MKTKKLIGSAAVLVLLASAGSYELGRYQASQANGNSVDYVGSSQKNPKASTTSNEKSMVAISKEEGISAEQIVVKITDKGYVTSHGDHYHYYNGKVPYNALISEELLMTDPNYVFQKSDVINEVKDGYIIKVDGKYYLYLKADSPKKNLRTKAQIAEQAAKGAKEAKEAKAGRRSEKHGGQSHQKVAKTLKASAKEITAAKRAGRYTTDDGYIFNPSDVIEDTGDAYIVPHGNHFHYIPKADLSASELAAAQAVWSRKSGKGTPNAAGRIGHSPSSAISQPALPKVPGLAPNHSIATPSKPHASQNNHPSTAKGKPTLTQESGSKKADQKRISYQELLQRLYAQPLEKRHRESDGLVFDPNAVTKYTSRGYVIPHGDHWHVVPASHLSPLEIQLANMHLSGQGSADRTEMDSLTEKASQKAKQPQLPKKPEKKSLNLLDGSIVKTAKGKDGKPYTTDDGYTFSVASITSYDENGIIAEHNGHEHYIPYGDLDDDELTAVQKAIAAKGSKITKLGKSQFSKAEIAKKLQYLSLRSDVPVSQLKIAGDKVIIPHGDHTHTAELKNLPSALHPNQFEDQSDYETMIMQLKMGKVKQDYQTDNVIRSGHQLIVYAKDGSTKKISLDSIKLPLDYQEVDYSRYGRKAVSPALPPAKEEKVSEERSAATSEMPTTTETQTEATTSIEPVKESVETLDPQTAKLQRLAQQYGLDLTTFESRLNQVTNQYGISQEAITFGAYLSFTLNGKAITFDIVNMVEVA